MSPPVDTVRGDGKLPAAADVVVIGGSIIGCSAAYFLAKKGLSVAVIEKGQIAGEQSSRNWGWCRPQDRDTRETPLIKESLALWGGLNEEVGADTGFRRTGLLYVTKDAAELARWHPRQCPHQHPRSSPWSWPHRHPLRKDFICLGLASGTGFG